MKNNILLILAVTVISIGIIIATVLISGAGSDERTSSRTSGAQSTTSAAATTSATTVTTAPPVIQTTTAAPLPQTVESAPYDVDMAASIMVTAHSLIGIDFTDGGDSPNAGFDNSGFIYYVLRENGFVSCPRGVVAQSQMGTALSYDELRPGDLAYFYAEDMQTISFGGVYCGDGIMVACLMPGTQVMEIDITSPYYQKYFYRGVSLT